MVEEWRAVVERGYEDAYEVSSLGRVRSTATGRILTPGAHPKGYLSLTLSVGGKRRSVLIHRLVLAAFVGPAPVDQEARHLDGIRSHNEASNLAWGTSAENEHDKRRHGTSSMGEGNSQAKISDLQVDEIRARAARGESQRSIARAMGISQPQVCRIVTGRRRGPRP